MDTMSHHNNASLTIEAGQAQDEAVGVVRPLADERTLLVVAAFETLRRALTMMMPNGDDSLKTVTELGEEPRGNINLYPGI